MPLFSNESKADQELFDKEWRDEVKKTCSETMDSTLDTTEYYSKMLKEYLIENPIEKVGDWKESFKNFCTTKKNTTHDFLEKQYENSMEHKEKAKEKAAETASNMESKAADYLEKWAKSLKSNAEQ